MRCCKAGEGKCPWPGLGPRRVSTSLTVSAFRKSTRFFGLAGLWQAAQFSTSTGRMGLAGWVSPNTPIGSEASGWRGDTGWFALGFAIEWGGPPSTPAKRAGGPRPAAASP